MDAATVDLPVCPVCHECLDYAGMGQKTFHAGLLICSRCNKEYPIVDGIPHFVESEALTGFNRRFAPMYNWFSWIKALFSQVAFACIGMDEETSRREITDRLEPRRVF